MTPSPTAPGAGLEECKRLVEACDRLLAYADELNANARADGYGGGNTFAKQIDSELREPLAALVRSQSAAVVVGGGEQLSRKLGAHTVYGSESAMDELEAIIRQAERYTKLKVHDEEVDGCVLVHRDTMRMAEEIYADREQLRNDFDRLADAFNQQNGPTFMGEPALESALRAQPGGEGFDTRDDWISAATIDQYIEGLADEYEFRGDDGDYTPNEQERMLLIDFAHGFMVDEMLLAMLRSHFDPNTRGYQKPPAAPTRVDVASGMGKGDGK